MIEKLSCNSCGGPLEVPERTRYLNCNHCGQSLAVKHSETATFTEAMEQLTEVAEDVAEDVAS
jgi:DNA-directed RNA polymerase subunit RPC12/RpoP